MSEENIIIDEVIERDILQADEGHYYTNGTTIYGRIIYLAADISKDDFYQITDEEYNELFPEVIPETE